MLQNRTVLRVEVLTPRGLDEALRLKAERPDALPIQGGTDVMVALNFDRSRPETVLSRDLFGRRHVVAAVGRPRLEEDVPDAVHLAEPMRHHFRLGHVGVRVTRIGDKRRDEVLFGVLPVVDDQHPPAPEQRRAEQL